MRKIRNLSGILLINTTNRLEFSKVESYDKGFWAEWPIEYYRFLPSVVILFSDLLKFAVHVREKIDIGAPQEAGKTLKNEYLR